MATHLNSRALIGPLAFLLVAGPILWLVVAFMMPLTSTATITELHFKGKDQRNITDYWAKVKLDGKEPICQLTATSFHKLKVGQQVNYHWALFNPSCTPSSS